MDWLTVERDEPGQGLRLARPGAGDEPPWWRRAWMATAETATAIVEGVKESPSILLVLLLVVPLLALAVVLAAAGVAIIVMFLPMLLWLVGFAAPAGASLLGGRTQPTGPSPSDQLVRRLDLVDGGLVVELPGRPARRIVPQTFGAWLGPEGGGPLPIEMVVDDRRHKLLVEGLRTQADGQALIDRLALELGFEERHRSARDLGSLSLRYDLREEGGRHPYRTADVDGEPLGEAPLALAFAEEREGRPGEEGGAEEASAEGPEERAPDIPAPEWLAAPGEIGRWSARGTSAVVFEPPTSRVWQARPLGLLLGAIVAFTAAVVVFGHLTFFAMFEDATGIMTWVMAILTLACWLPRQLREGWRVGEHLDCRLRATELGLVVNGRFEPVGEVKGLWLGGGRDLWLVRDGEDDLPLARFPADARPQDVLALAVPLAAALRRPWICFAAS